MARRLRQASMEGPAGFLSGVSLFAALPEGDRRTLGEACHVRRFRPGEALFHEGDPGYALYVVSTGRVKILLTAPDGSETILHVYGPGDCLGELSLLDGEPRCASAVALDHVETLALYRDDFLALMDRHPALARSLVCRLAGMVRQLNEQVQDASMLDIRGRLAKRLLELADRYGEAAPEGRRITVPLTQQELGQMVGGARSNVNRVLNGFQSRGILTLDRGSILIHRPDDLWRQIDLSS
jgi:CRP/FNR family cyclic AMP-dependent transcriptional regulator